MTETTRPTPERLAEIRAVLPTAAVFGTSTVTELLAEIDARADVAPIREAFRKISGDSVNAVAPALLVESAVMAVCGVDGLRDQLAKALMERDDAERERDRLTGALHAAEAALRPLGAVERERDAARARLADYEAGRMWTEYGARHHQEPGCVAFAADADEAREIAHHSGGEAVMRGCAYGPWRPLADTDTTPEGGH